jgi:23S rRNA pseudouridine2605 synthase
MKRETSRKRGKRAPEKRGPRNGQREHDAKQGTREQQGENDSPDTAGTAAAPRAFVDPEASSELASEPETEAAPSLVRLNKYLADHGIASRRKCDELIAGGQVTVDGAVTTELGRRIDPEREAVEIDGYFLKPHGRRRRYYLLNKPAGVVCTNEPRETRRRAVDLITDARKGRIYTVGRLDEESSGLILLTNDGDFANRIMHPRYGVEKTYLVRVAGRIEDDALMRIREGVHLSEGRTSGARVLVDKRMRDQSMLTVTLREGMNREIRRAFAQVGYKVLDLRRVRIGPLTDRGLKVGRWREVERDEVAALLEGRNESAGDERAQRGRHKLGAKGARKKGGAREFGEPSFKRHGESPHSRGGAFGHSNRAEELRPRRGESAHARSEGSDRPRRGEPSHARGGASDRSRNGEGFRPRRSESSHSRDGSSGHSRREEGFRTPRGESSHARGGGSDRSRGSEGFRPRHGESSHSRGGGPNRSRHGDGFRSRRSDAGHARGGASAHSRNGEGFRPRRGASFHSSGAAPDRSRPSEGFRPRRGDAGHARGGERYAGPRGERRTGSPRGSGPRTGPSRSKAPMRGPQRGDKPWTKRSHKPAPFGANRRG